jgi:hypothetical protein
VPLGDIAYADDYLPSFGLDWVPVLSREQLAGFSMEESQKYYQLRTQLTINAEDNPTGAGWVLPSWRLVMQNWNKYSTHVILGGNRSTKSTLASRLCVWGAGTIPNAEVRAYHVNEDRSIEDQQRFIWDALPIGIKNLSPKKGPAWSVQYTQKNGFTDNICILPPLPGCRRGGTIKFGNYRQYQQDSQVAEGFKSHIIWCDEEAPQKFFETLHYRVVDYHGRIILTFTTLEGWTGLVQDILGKTRTLIKRYAPLAGKELPIMQESLGRPSTAIYYFWTEDNAFIDTSDFVEKIKGRPKAELLARAYGVPTKSVDGVFPAFSKEVNVIPHEELPWLKPKKDKHGNPIPYPVTRYMAVDPAGSKNWFMLWVAIDPAGTWWVYREWPDYDDWAEPGPTPDGKPGPASKGSKKGIRDYVELIRHLEGGEEIYERIIDPRFSAAERQAEEGATTVLTDLDNAGMTFIPAPGGSNSQGKGEIEDGLQLINDLLAWDETKPQDGLNHPRLYISDRCQNFIYAMAEYTNHSTHEACKDPIDCLRYLRKANCDYYAQKDLQAEARTFSY